jgi:hypothetical protein
MSAQSIVCGACGAAVPYGRLSCPECGELLASGVGGARRMVTGAVAGGTSVATLLADTVPAAEPELPASASADVPEAAAATPDPSPATLDDAPPVARPIPSVLRDAEPAGMIAAATWSDPDYEPATNVDVDADPDVVLEPLDRDVAPTPAWIASAGLATETAPNTSLFGAMPAGPYAAAGAAVALPAATPGAYVPPMPAVFLPAGPAAPARAWGNGDLPAPDGAAGGSGRAAPVAAAVGAARAMERPRLVDATRWLAVGGAALAVAGFVLPWATSVIGAGGLGYFDRWGLAGSGHLLLLVALLAVLAMALIKNPVPVWLRVGVPGLGLGALLLGLAWPYVFSSVLGPQLGVYGVAVGAVLLMIAGVVAIWSDRHETEIRPV